MLKTLYNGEVRMKRLLTALALWMALCAGAFAQVRNATVTYTYLGVQLRGFRVGEEFMIPLDRVIELGWSANSSSVGAKISAEGRSFQVPTRQIEGLTCIAMRDLIQKLDGSSSWIPGGYDALEVVSAIKSVSVKSGELSISAGLKIRPTVSLMGTTDQKVVIDLEGARLAPGVQLDLDSTAKVSQYRPNNVRIVLNLPFTPTLPQGQLANAQNIVIDFNPVQRLSPEPNKPDPIKTDPSKVNPPKVDQAPPVQTGDIGVVKRNEDEMATELFVSVPQPGWKGIATIRRPSRDVVEIAMPTMSTKLAEIDNDLSKHIRSVQLRQDTGLTILSFKLAGRMGAVIDPAADGFKLTFVHPAGNGSLKGKVIVIDAGHGGVFPGCGNGEFSEKLLTLKTAMAVKKALEAEGAQVIMTRETDKNFKSSLEDDLIERADIANRNNADVFLSFHYDDYKGSTDPHGTKSMYHEDIVNGALVPRASSKYLSECLQDAIAKEGPIPNLGPKSDRKFAPDKGYSILRNAKMPAILMECAFVRNPKSKKVILTDQFRDDLAKCVVKGLKLFFQK